MKHTLCNLFCLASTWLGSRAHCVAEITGTSAVRSVFALLCLLPLSCKMGPDYSRPGVNSPDSFRMETTSQEASSIANLPWWELLKHAELQRLIQIALEGNKDLQEAAATVEEYQARFGSARLQFAPKLG